MTTFVELGAGVTGLPSIALLRMGKEVVTTDIHALVPTLQRNLDGNTRDDFGYAEAQPLVWTHQDDPALAQSIEKIMRNERFRNGFDGIAMCDCIYSEASAPALVDTIRALSQATLERSGTAPMIICFSEIRNQAAQDEFVRCLGARKDFEWTLLLPSEWHRFVPLECRLEYINLYHIRLNQALK